MKNIYIKTGDLKRFVPFIIWPVFLTFVFHYFKQVSSGGHIWKTADWLISYYVGPVRRGLIGSLLIFISDFGISLKWLVFSVQVVFYFLIFFLTQKLYLMRERGYEWLMLLFSPAFIFFPFYSFRGSFRKEIIVFVSFLVLANFYARRNISSKTISASFVLYLLAAFSHEMAAFTLPFFAYILFQSFRSGMIERRLALISIALFSAAALSSLLFAMAFPATSAGEQICVSAVSRGFSYHICEGAIAALRYDAGHWIGLVRSYQPEYTLIYLPLAILAMIPLFISDWFRKNAALLLISFGFISPLFLLSTDWGRWIQVYAFFVFVLMLAESVLQDIKIRKLPIWLLLVYLSVWSIPHCCAHNIGYGLVGMLLMP